jgi:hypothetical protein
MYMTDTQAANGLTVGELHQWRHCAALVIRRDVSDAERRTALRRLDALRGIWKQRVFG